MFKVKYSLVKSAVKHLERLLYKSFMQLVDH